MVYSVVFDIDHPPSIKKVDLNCTIGDTLGVFTFKILPVSNGAIANMFDFTGVQIQTAILKLDNTVLDNALIINSVETDGIFTVTIKQTATVTQNYPKGNHSWYLKLVFSDGVKRTFYRGKIIIS